METQNGHTWSFFFDRQKVVTRTAPFRKYIVYIFWYFGRDSTFVGLILQFSFTLYKTEGIYVRWPKHDSRKTFWSVSYCSFHVPRTMIWFTSSKSTNKCTMIYAIYYPINLLLMFRRICNPQGAYTSVVKTYSNKIIFQSSYTSNV